MTHMLYSTLYFSWYHLARVVVALVNLCNQAFFNMRRGVCIEVLYHSIWDMSGNDEVVMLFDGSSLYAHMSSSGALFV